MYNNELKKAVKISSEIITEKKSLTYALTGAGISKASNIPTFRGKDGLWEKYDLEEIATYNAWMKNSEKLWKLYLENVSVINQAKPNSAHLALATLEEKGYINYLITQNVDSLHQKAGSKNIIELHGNLSRIRCSKCRTNYNLNELKGDTLMRCQCGGFLRPDVVLFDEILPEREIKKSLKIAKEAELVLVIGTSAEVMLAASLPYLSKRNGAKIIIFNPEKTEHTQLADAFIKGKCENLLPTYVEELIKELESY